MKIEFLTSAYCFAHGHPPRGRGGWAFRIDRSAAIFWANGTYVEAKKAAAEEAKRLAPSGYAGHIQIEVLS